jgi:hypothetical protein
MMVNLWENMRKKEKKRREEKVEKGFAQFGTLSLGKSITLV